MKTILIWSLAFGACLGLVASPAMASDPAPTTISVPDMHCAGCAKKLATELNKVVGVAKVETDVEAKTVKVTPKGKNGVSPKSLWEAVEAAGKTPNKLEGPDGSFSSKPKK